MPTTTSVLPRLTATRYVTPLREGGSLPGLMEADDLGTYVVKYVGAGQGRKALVAEIIGTRLARALGLPVADLALVDVDPVLADNEPDPEVQDLLRRSGGLNLGVDYLPGALDLDARVLPVPPALAGRVLWFDALVNNVDRSWRNPNMLMWHGTPYLIDHGATLPFHHAWSPAPARHSYDASRHALLAADPELDAADGSSVDATMIAEVVAAVPDEWLVDEPGFADPPAVRAAYVERLLDRFDHRDEWWADVRAAVG